MQKERCAVLVDDEVTLRHCAAIAEIRGSHGGDRGARLPEQLHNLVRPPRRRVADRRKLRATRVDFGAPVEELLHEPCIAKLADLVHVASGLCPTAGLCHSLNQPTRCAAGSQSRPG